MIAVFSTCFYRIPELRSFRDWQREQVTLSLIYLTGIAGIFPEGIFVGEIASIDDPADSEFLKVEVSFMQSPLNQDFYLIYNNE